MLTRPRRPDNVVVGRSLLEKAQALRLGGNARQVLESAKRFYEGCWLYIKVSSRRDILDVLQFIALKAKPRPLRKEALSRPRATRVRSRPQTGI